MQLVGLRIRHYRTVGSVDVDLPLDRPLTLVGPNNSGKTNILRAIELLFTGHENELGYRTDRDLTFNLPNAKTSLLATFRGDDGSSQTNRILAQNVAEAEASEPDTETEEGDEEAIVFEEVEIGMDQDFFGSYDRLDKYYGRTRADNVITLSLVFSPSGTPVYQFFPNLKKPKDSAAQAAISRLQRQLVTELLSKFSCHYIPSAKSVQQLYDEVLNPFLRSAAARAVFPQLAELTAALDGVAKGINDELDAVGLGSYNASFALPDGKIESLLSTFEFNMNDPHETPISHKGQGIQSTAFMAALRWVTAEEAKRGRQSVWLLEEPESYLHPELMGTVQQLLRRLSGEVAVVTSTHSLTFVPQDVAEIIGTRLDSEGRTEALTYASSIEAGASLRAALGVKFSDYYNLAEFNVAVEGKSDRETLEWYLRTVTVEDAPLPHLRMAAIHDFGGVRHLGGWLRATYAFIRHERALVSMFDGDLAGERERRDLVGYLGGKDIPFQPNQQYVIVRSGHAIEGLFPDTWLKALNTEHPGWFEDFAVDATASLQSMRFKDGSKANALTWLKLRAETDPESGWRFRFDALAAALDQALKFQGSRVTM